MESRGQKIQCINCLSTEEPKIVDNGVICSDCNEPLQTYINLSAEEIQTPLFEN